MLIQTSPFLRMPVTMGGALFDPNFPSSLSHLEEWYDSRDGYGCEGYAHGANVLPWPDNSGNGRDQGSDGFFLSPTMLRTSDLSPKGIPLVRYNGANMTSVTGTINPFPASTRGWSFYAYGNFSFTTAPPAPFAGSIIWWTDVFTSTPKELLLHVVAGNQLAYRDGGATRQLAATQTGFHQVAYVFSPPSGAGAATVYVDGVAAGTFTPWTTGANGPATTGISNGNVPLHADLGHFLWYSDEHSAVTVAKFHLWASIFWGF